MGTLHHTVTRRILRLLEIENGDALFSGPNCGVSRGCLRFGNYV
jgi:hypothetical protein